MRVTDGAEGLGRQSLRWDAGYCTVVGAAAVVFAVPLADHPDVAVRPIVVAGSGTLGWAALLRVPARTAAWRRSVALVAAVDLAVSIGIAVWTTATSGPGGAVLGLIALQVGVRRHTAGGARVGSWLVVVHSVPPAGDAPGRVPAATHGPLRLRERPRPMPLPTRPDPRRG